MVTGEADACVVTVAGAPCLTPTSAPVSMLNRRSSCCRSCSALLSSRCCLRSSACNSFSSRASSRASQRSSADCCHVRRQARALSRRPWLQPRAPPWSHDAFPPRRCFFCRAEVRGGQTFLCCSGMSCGTGPSSWVAAVAGPAMFESLKPGEMKKKKNLF